MGLRFANVAAHKQMILKRVERLRVGQNYDSASGNGEFLVSYDPVRGARGQVRLPSTEGGNPFRFGSGFWASRV